MKLVIDIPEKTIAHIRSNYGHGCKGLLDEDREIIVNEIYKARMYVEFGAYINGYLKALEDKEWIPVTERLPEEREWYLAVFKEKDTDFQLIPRVADYIGHGENKWRWIDEEGIPQEYFDLLECVAWMPLPEPYGGDK